MVLSSKLFSNLSFRFLLSPRLLSTTSSTVSSQYRSRKFCFHLPSTTSFRLSSATAFHLRQQCCLHTSAFQFSSSNQSPNLSSADPQTSARKGLEVNSSNDSATVHATKTESPQNSSLSSSQLSRNDIKPTVIPVAKKLSLLTRIKNEMIHYWHGTKLLWKEIKISTRLMWKMNRGNKLTRREHNQVQIIDVALLMTDSSWCELQSTWCA